MNGLNVYDSYMVNTFVYLNRIPHRFSSECILWCGHFNQMKGPILMFVIQVTGNSLDIYYYVIQNFIAESTRVHFASFQMFIVRKS